MRVAAGAAVMIVGGLAGSAFADDHDQVAGPRGVDAVLFPADVRGADLGGAAAVHASGGWDGGHDQADAMVTADVRVVSRAWVTAQVRRRADGTFSPGGGIGLRLYRDVDRGVTLGAVALYKAEGFADAEGELEATLAAGLDRGRFHGTLDLTYGQDWENVERDAEATTAAHVDLGGGGTWFAGGAAHYRDGLGTAEVGVERDLQVTALAGRRFSDSLAMFAQAGVSGVDPSGADFHVGPMLGLSVAAVR